MKVLITGPILGYNRGREKSQAEFLIDLLSKKGLDIVWASKYPNRVKRAVDIYRTIVKNKDAMLGIVMVYSYGAFFYADMASYLLKSAGIPVIFWLHGGALPEFTDRKTKWVIRVLKRAALLVAPSLYLASYYRKFGLDVKVIPNIVFSERYPYHGEDHIEPRLLWMRTFHPLYNPKMAILAFKEILKEIPDATLTMAGVDRGIMNEVIDLSKKLGLSDRIIFPGFLDEKGKYNAFKSNYIYLHTNNVDNTPVSVIEALTSGLIVIATDTGGIPYLLTHGKNALLVKPNDYSKMARYVVDIVKGNINYKNLRKNGKELAMESDGKKIVNKWLSIIESVNRKDV